MKNNINNIIIGIIIGIVIGFWISKMFYLIKLKYEQRKSGKQSVKKSKSVILGQVHEKIAPILPGFPYNYKDMTFIGKGIDYIVFDGLSAGNLKQIILLEIKTGKSNLNKNERMIQYCTRQKKIKYEIYRPT